MCHTYTLSKLSFVSGKRGFIFNRPHFALRLRALLSLSFLWIFLFAHSGNTLSAHIISFSRDTLKEAEWGLFKSDELIEMSLTFDITAFLDEKPEKEYLDARMVLNHGRPDSLQLDIKLRARGNFRYHNCQFPPVRLNLKNSGSSFSDLAEMSNLKLVTHCRNNEEYIVYLLREYLVYKLYSIITDNSFRVRLLRIHYRDSGEGGNSFTSLGFVIEPVALLEKRLGAKEVEEEGVTLEMLGRQNSDRLSLFQFMIANNDWFVYTFHNVKLFRTFERNNDIDYIAVPYDFDYSGFVNAKYAVDNPDQGIEKLRERTFAGVCRPSQEWKEDMEDFKGYRKGMLKEIDALKLLEAKERNDLKQFIRSFYSLYHNDKIVDIIMETCTEQDKSDN